MEFPPHEILAGTLRREFVLMPDGRVRLDTPGGDLLYCAAGFLLWQRDPPPGLLARVGSDYPTEWIDDFASHGLVTKGITVQPEEIDLRQFIAYVDLQTRLTDNPIPHFTRLGLPFPKALLGYQDPSVHPDSLSKQTSTSIRKSDIPEYYHEAGAIHMGPIDYLTHSLLPAALRQRNINIITVDPSPGYMNALFWNHIGGVVNGLSAFLPSEEEVRNLFHGRSKDIWEMAEALAAFGCDIIVIKRGLAGQYLYEAITRTRWELPAYPNQVSDPTGAGSSFCGGFLAGYRQTYDALEALLHGSISASFTVEGSGPWYALDTMPGLPEARLESLRGYLHKI
jgi:hypothetical protein